MPSLTKQEQEKPRKETRIIPCPAITRTGRNENANTNGERKRDMNKKEIKTTTDYSMFKTLDGNRAIKDKRVDKIVQSILKIGYITSPILVNEHMEVIDGQGRLAALERLSMPVEYIVHEGIGIEECRQMNIHQSNWTDYDYVCSYATRGDENYQRLQSLMDRFDLPAAVIIAAASGGTGDFAGQGNKRIRNGAFKLTEKDAERAKWELMYAMNFKQVAKNVGGRNNALYHAVIYAYRNLDTEGRNKMETVIRKKMLEIPALSKVSGYLKYFDGFYNAGLRKENRIHLALQWETDQI